MRAFFILNSCLWFVLCIGWLGYVGLMGPTDPVSVQVAFILALTACLLTVQRWIRFRRRRKVRASA